MVFLNQFVDQATLIGFISMCDVYATPYLNEAQMTSGTLAYSFGLGKAIVSTPYWHARELLANDGGILVPFGDSAAIGEAIANLLTDDVPTGGHAQARLRTEPADDLATDSTALSGHPFEGGQRSRSVRRTSPSAPTPDTQALPGRSSGIF